MTEAEAMVKAGEIIGVHHEQGFAYVACGDGTNYLLDFGDKHERISTFVRKVREAISAALLAASRPGEGMIRTHEGKDLRLLGTLPVTADGCVAMPDECNVYAPGCDEALQPVRSIRFDEDPNTMAERLRECGFQFPGESLPEFVAVWTDYDRDTGAYDEFVAPLSACYSTPEAASAAKGVGDGE